MELFTSSEHFIAAPPLLGQFDQTSITQSLTVPAAVVITILFPPIAGATNFIHLSLDAKFPTASEQSAKGPFFDIPEVSVAKLQLAKLVETLTVVALAQSSPTVPVEKENGPKTVLFPLAPQFWRM
jgi:hypothetical protein